MTSTESGIPAVEARGADVVLANSQEDVISKVRAAAPELLYVFDTVVTDDSMMKIVQCTDKPVKIATATKYTGELAGGVEVVSVFSGEIMGRTMTGARSEAGEQLRTWLWGNLSGWLQRSEITPLESEVIGGIDAIPSGLVRMKEGTAKSKLVATLY